MKKKTLLLIVVFLIIMTIVSIVYAAPSLVLSESVLAIPEGGTANFQVSLGEAMSPAEIVNISITSNNPACTITSANPIGILNNPTTPRNVTVSVPDNITYTPNATCVINLTASGSNYGGVSAQLTVNIGENEVAPALVFTESGGTYVTESGGTDTFTINLNVMPTSNVEVLLSPDAQCTVNDNQLTFTTASWNTPKSITVYAVDDSADEANVHNCWISVTTIDGATANEYDNVGANFQVEVDDNDDTPPGLNLNPSSLAINEGQKDDFLVKLNSLPSSSVLVRARSNQPYICSVSPSEFTLTQSSFTTGKTFTVTSLYTYSAANLQCSIYVDTISNDGNYNGANKTLSVQTYNTWSATLTPVPATATPVPTETSIPATATYTTVPIATEIVPTNTPYVIVVTNTPEAAEEPTVAPVTPTDSGLGGGGTPSLGVIAIVAAAAIVLFGAVGIGAYFIVRKFF